MKTIQSKNQPEYCVSYYTKATNILPGYFLHKTSNRYPAYSPNELRELGATEDTLKELHSAAYPKTFKKKYPGNK